jgi:glucose dehydrogenase
MEIPNLSELENAPEASQIVGSIRIGDRLYIESDLSDIYVYDADTGERLHTIAPSNRERVSDFIHPDR